MRKSRKNISERFFIFIIDNLKKTLIILIIPQILLLFYENTVESKTCLATTKVKISKSVTDTKIVDEIFMENLKIDEIQGAEIYGRNIIIKDNNLEECKNIYNKIKNNFNIANKYVEDFYWNELDEQERARFAGPALFGFIGGKKIEFAKLDVLDLETFRNKEKKKKSVYIIILSIISLFVYFFASNSKKIKSYL